MAAKNATLVGAEHCWRAYWAVLRNALPLLVQNSSQHCLLFILTGSQKDVLVLKDCILRIFLPCQGC